MRFWHNSILFSGMIMLLLSTYFIINPARISISLIGAVMIASGLVLLAAYLNDHHEEDRTKWILAEGTVTFLLGAVLFLNNNISNQTLHFMFGLWLLFSGFIRYVAGMKAKKIPISGWMLIFILGTVTVLAGVISLNNSTSLAMIVGLLLSMEGLNTVSTYYYIGKL